MEPRASTLSTALWINWGVFSKHGIAVHIYREGRRQRWRETKRETQVEDGDEGVSKGLQRSGRDRIQDSGRSIWLCSKKAIRTFSSETGIKGEKLDVETNYWGGKVRVDLTPCALWSWASLRSLFFCSSLPPFLPESSFTFSMTTITYFWDNDSQVSFSSSVLSLVSYLQQLVCHFHFHGPSSLLTQHLKPNSSSLTSPNSAPLPTSLQASHLHRISHLEGTSLRDNLPHVSVSIEATTILLVTQINNLRIILDSSSLTPMYSSCQDLPVPFLQHLFASVLFSQLTATTLRWALFPSQLNYGLLTNLPISSVSPLQSILLMTVQVIFLK